MHPTTLRTSVAHKPKQKAEKLAMPAIIKCLGNTESILPKMAK
jgi:hypothetical protein